jgi:hypothetical protein
MQLQPSRTTLRRRVCVELYLCSALSKRLRIFLLLGHYTLYPVATVTDDATTVLVCAVVRCTKLQFHRKREVIARVAPLHFVCTPRPRHGRPSLRPACSRLIRQGCKIQSVRKMTGVCSKKAQNQR